MTSVANTVAMTTLAVHTLQPHIFYKKVSLSTVGTTYGTYGGTVGTYGTVPTVPSRYRSTGRYWYLLVP